MKRSEREALVCVCRCYMEDMAAERGERRGRERDDRFKASIFCTCCIGCTASR